MRISAVMQAHNSCCATEDTDCLNNISYLFQQLILSLQTTYPISFSNISYLFQQIEEGESQTYDTSSLFVDEVAASVTLAIFLQKLDNVFGILANVLFVSVISVDENH